MAYRDWLKEYREVNSVQKDSAQQKPTPGSTGSGGFRDSLNAYRKSQAPNIFADLQKSLTIEYDSYKNMKPTFGKYDETSKVINERLSSISHLRSTVEAYRNYMQDGVADGILSDLDQMKKGYDAYLGMSKYETEDDYNAAVNEWQDYTEQLNFDTAAEEKAIAEQIERYNQFFGIEATYKEVSSRPSMYTDEWVAEVTSRYNDYKSFIDQGGSLEGLKQSIQQRQVYLDNAKRLQEDYQIGWLIPDAETNEETVAARKSRYESNSSRIEAIKEELPWYGDTFLPSFVENIFLNDEQEALKEEMEMLEGDNLKYKRTQWVLDQYYTPVTEEFKQNAAYRDYSNASKEDLWTYDMSAIAGSAALSNGGYFDEDGNICDAKGNIVQSAAAPQIEDKLGMFLSASDEEITEAYYRLSNTNGNYTDTWANLMQEGDVNGWKHLKPEEIDIYYDLYKREGQEAAYKFLSYMTTELTRRETQEIQEYINEAPVLEQIFLNAASFPMSVFGGAIALADDAINLVQGEDINPYSRAHAFQNMASAIRSDTAKDINDLTGNVALPFAGTTFGDAYQSIMSFGDSVLASLIPGGHVLLGMNAASSEMKDLYERGGSTEQILAGGILAGAAEMFFEKISIGELKKIKNMDAKAVKNFADGFVRAMVMGGVEASEEMATEIANTISDALVMGSQTDWVDLETFVKNVVNAGIGGFISGGFGGAIAAKMNNAQYNKKVSKYGQSIIDKGGVDALQQLALEMSGSKDAMNAHRIDKLANKVSSKVTAKNVGKLSDLIGDTTTAQNLADITKALEQKGMSKKDAKRVAEYLNKVSQGEYFTEQEAAEVEGDKRIIEVLRDVVADPKSSVNARVIKLIKARLGNAAQAEQTQRGEEIVSAEGDLPTTAENASESRYKVSADGKAINTKTGEAIDIKGVASIRDGEMVLETSDGNTINASEVSYASEEQALIYEAVANLGNKVDAKTANKLISQYKGGNALVFAKGISQAYSYGFWGIDKSELRGKNSLATELTDAQMNYAYGLGSQYRVTRDTADKAKARATKAPAEKGVYFRDKDGSVTDIRSYMKKANKTLTPVRKIAIEVMEKMSAAMGIRFNIFESWTENGVSYYLNEDGVKTKGNPNGFYDPRTGEIYIDINAGNDYSGTMLFTVAHELTHFLRQWSPEHFTKISKIVFKHGGMKGSVAELVAEKQKKARSKGRSLSFDAALEEVVADGMETILKDGKVLEFMAEIKLKDRTAWNKIKEWFDKLGTFLKELINAYDGRTANSVEGQYVAEFSRDLLNQIEQIFAEGMVEAGENYQGTVAETDFLKAEKTTIKDGGVKMYSLREFQDGKRFVDVKTDPNVFNGMSVAEMNRTVKKILTERFAGRVIGVDNRVFVNGDSVNEYLHPSKSIDIQIRKAKLAAANELDNLLDAGTALPDEADGKDGHIHPDVIDFSYYQTVFKVGNEYFEGVVNVKNIKRGKLLKDVTKIRNITKDIVSSYGSNPKSNFLRDVSMNSISNDNKDVNQKIFDLEYMDTVSRGDMTVARKMVDQAEKAQKSTTEDGGVDGEYDIKLSSREENAFKQFAKAISSVVNQSISGKGNIDGKAQVKDIMPTGPKITAMVAASSGNAIDISQRNIALSSSDIWHEYKRHTQEKQEISRGQIAFTKRQFQNAVKCIISPDIVETIFADPNNPTQKQSFAYAKKTSRGNYVVVEAVGGKKNPHIYPVMILQFNKAKWDNMMSQGKTLGEILFENDLKKLKALDVQQNKKSRVTAAQFASYEAIANTLRSPQLDSRISQSELDVKNESAEAIDVEVDDGGEKFSEREELSSSEFNRLTKKKPINVSAQEWAMIRSQRKTKYSGLEEYDIPIIDFFKVGDYRIVNNGFIYCIRNSGPDDFSVVMKKQIAPDTRRITREVIEDEDRSNDAPTDSGVGKKGSKRGSDRSSGEYTGNGRELSENDRGTVLSGEPQRDLYTRKGDADSGAVKHSDRDYSYEALISKPDMTVTAVDSNVPKNRADVVYQAKQNAANVGKFDPKTGSVSVYVDDVEADVILATNGLKHSLDRRSGVNAPIVLKAGVILQNSIRINDLTPKKADATESYVLIGTARNDRGELYIVRSVVNKFSNELASMDVLYAINAKKEPAALLPRLAEESAIRTDSTISIAELLDHVNEYFPDILPEDVLKHYGYDARPKGDLGESVLYQERADRDIDLFDIASCPKVKMSQSEYRRLQSEAMIWNADKIGKVIYQTLSNQYTYVYCFDESHNIIVLGKYKAKNIHERQAVIDDKRNRTKPDRNNGGSRRRRRTDSSDVLDSDGGTAKKSNSPLEEAPPETRTSDGRGYAEGTFDADKTGVKMSERDTESFSNRSLLANALESLTQNEIERKKIQEYKDKIGLIDAEERKLRELNEQIKELSFAKGKRDTNKISQLRDEARKTANRISIYDKQLLRLEASKPLQEVLDREKKKAYKKAEKKGQEALAAYRERAAKAQQELLDRYRESRKKAVESRERTAMRHKIRSVVGELNQLLLSDDKKRHVPDSMKRAVADALALVNMDTVGAEERAAKYAALIAKETDPDKIDAYTTTMENILRQGEKTGQRLKELRDAYEEIQNSDDPDIANAYDPVIAGSLKELAQTIGNTALKDMTIEQLSDVYDMYKMVLTRVRDANKSLIASVKETIANRAFRVAEEVRKAGGEHKYRAAVLDLAKTLSWNNTKPVYAMERIGSATMTEAYNNVRKGEDTWAKDVTEARAYYIDKSKKYGYDSWDFQAKYRFESASGLEFELTLEQILSLYAFSKREQAYDHLRFGGFVFDSNIETYKEKGSKILKYKVNTADAHQITPEILANITGTLTKEQMRFVDEMQEYLSTVMGAKGNEVTIAMYGVKLFKEKFYFPLKTAKQFMFEQNEVSGEVRIKNAGFTNKVVPKANNPVILSNFMDVWANHINDMSMYHAFVLPLEDFNRIFNYNSPRQEGKPPVSVKGIVQNAYGPAAVNYVKQLIIDLNGGPMADPRETFAKAMTAKFKKAKVFSSLSVVIQQPSAIARAFALVNPKYFQPTRDGMNHDALWAELKQYAPVAIIKEMGYFDTNMGRSTLDFIKAKEYDTFKEKAKAIFSDAGYRDEVFSKAPALADELTWCAIWNAVKRETAVKHNGLKPNSEEFLKAAGERFTEVITKTQVYDSVLARSANMRSKSGMMNMITSFMAEPTTSINMLEDAIRKGKRGYKGYAVGAFASVLLSVLLNNALVALVYGMRDDDEDETFAEKYMQALVSGVLEDINPITYYPFLRDVWSASQGYSIDRSDMSLMSDLADALTGIAKAYITEDGDVSGAWWDVVDAVANIGGVPLENIRRDVNGAINLISTIIEDVNGRATTRGSMGDALESAVRKSLPVVGWFPGDTKADNLYDAIISGDTAYVDRLKGSYKTKDAYHSAVRKTLRENDPRIKEAAIAGFNGNPSERVRIAKQIIADGFDQDDVVMAINAEITAMKPDADTGSSKKKGYYTAADFAMEIANGDHDAAKAAKEDVIKTAERNGKSAEEAEKSFVSSAKTELKELFVSDGISEAKVATALKTYCQTEDDPLDDNDIYWLLKKWSYEKDTGSTDGYAKYGDFHAAVETGRNLKSVIKEYTDHGVESKTLASEITEHFKPIYRKMSRAERAAIKGYLLNAYAQLGYDRQKKSKDIDKWLED